MLLQNAERPEIVSAFSYSHALNDKYIKNNSATLNLTAVKSVDSVVLYSGVSFTKSFEAEADIFGFIIGSAFAVNNKIAFGGEFSFNQTQENKASLSPSSVFTIRETYTTNKKLSVEPSLAFGLSKNSPDTTLGLSFSWSM